MDVSLVVTLLKKEPMVFCELVESAPCVSAETVKACALIGLHMKAEENAFGWAVTLFLTWETCGVMAAQKTLIGAGRWAEFVK